MISRVSLARRASRLEEFTHLPRGVWAAPHICSQEVEVPVVAANRPRIRLRLIRLVVVSIQSSCVLVANLDTIYTVGMSWGSSLN